MALIIIIDAFIVGGLLALTLTKDLERTLPFFVFVMVLLPVESQIEISGLFTLMSQRVALITLVALYLLPRKGKGETAPIVGTPLKFLLLLHISWCLVSTANSIVIVSSTKKVLKEVIEYYVMYYILTKTITKIETVHKIIGAMVLAVFVACVFGSFEAYTGFRITQWFPEVSGRFAAVTSASGRGNRIYSTFANYSLFGAAISFAIIESLYLMTLAKSRVRKMLLWIAVLVMFLNVYKTVTRGPWLSLILGLVLLLLLCGQNVTRKHILIICTLALSVMIIRPGVYQTIKDMYLGTMDPDSQLGSSYEYRYALVDLGARAVARETTRSMWGYGMESWYELDLEAPFGANPAYHFVSCDNAWVEYMVETGYMGLLIIAALLIRPALKSVRNVWRLPKPDSYLCAILFINMVQYYFMMTNVAIYAWGQTGYMLWIWIAITMIYPALRQAEASNTVQPVDLEPQWAELARA